MARGRTKGPARNAAQLSRSYSKLAYRLTSFRLGRVVDGVLRCCDLADSFRYTGSVHAHMYIHMHVHVWDPREFRVSTDRWWIDCGSYSSWLTPIWLTGYGFYYDKRCKCGVNFRDWHLPINVIFVRRIKKLCRKIWFNLLSLVTDWLC